MISSKHHKREINLPTLIFIIGSMNKINSSMRRAKSTKKMKIDPTKSKIQVLPLMNKFNSLPRNNPTKRIENT
jgi:hypothetical protein